MRFVGLAMVEKENLEDVGVLFITFIDGLIREGQDLLFQRFRSHRERGSLYPAGEFLDDELIGSREFRSLEFLRLVDACGGLRTFPGFRS